MNKNLRISPEAFLSVGCLLILLLLCVAGHGGYLHWESSAFLLNYQENRPLLELVFDPRRNDWNLYQAREFSYLFDWIDSQAIWFLLRRGVAQFYSFSALALLTGIVFLQQYAARRLYPCVSSLTLTLLSLWFILVPAVNKILYFRSAKYLCAFGVTALVFAADARLRGWKYGSWATAAALILLVLCDRQGFFLAAAFAVFASLMAGFRNGDPWRALGWIGVAATGFGVCNNLWITPFLIRTFNHYPVDFAYQQNFSLSVGMIGNGVLFFAGNLGRALTTLSGTAGIAAGIAAILVPLVVLRSRGAKWGWLLIAGALILLAGGMAARHPPVLEPEIGYGTYFLPMLALVAALSPAGISQCSRRIRRKAAAPMLALAVTLQLIALCRETERFPIDRYQRIYQEAAPEFKRALSDPSVSVDEACFPARLERVVEIQRMEN